MRIFWTSDWQAATLEMRLPFSVDTSLDILAVSARNAKTENIMIANVDETYLERKRQSLLHANVHCAPLHIP